MCGYTLGASSSLLAYLQKIPETFRNLVILIQIRIVITHIRLIFSTKRIGKSIGNIKYIFYLMCNYPSLLNVSLLTYLAKLAGKNRARSHKSGETNLHNAATVINSASTAIKLFSELQ